MKVFDMTDIGLFREENQDCVKSIRLSESTCAAVLCDGMGGETHGELASRIAVDIITARIAENYTDYMNKNTVRNLLITSVSAANTAVFEEAMKQPSGTVMGTTCVAAIVAQGTAFIVNVGDSRAYHLFSNEDSECIQQITRDHSHVRDLIERGEITEEQAKTHPDRNRITRAIGAQSNVTTDYFEIEMNKGDMLLLCSDGLSSYGDDMEILDICFENPPEAVCGKLIDYALHCGGQDNISTAFFVVE